MRKTLAALAILAFFVLLAACSGGSGSEGALKIVRAEWVADGGEARAVVSGEWVRGLSTPPSCRLLENGKASEWPGPESNTMPDGNSFTKEFAAGKDFSLDPLSEYEIRCSINLSTGRTLDAVAPVSGEIPRG